MFLKDIHNTVQLHGNTSSYFTSVCPSFDVEVLSVNDGNDYDLLDPKFNRHCQVDGTHRRRRYSVAHRGQFTGGRNFMDRG